MIVYVEILKNKKKFPELIRYYSNVTGNKVNVQNSIAFLYAGNECVEFETKNTIPFTLNSNK